MSSELLSNTDIEHYCRKLKIPLVAILQKNLFKTLSPKPGAYVVNLQSTTEGSGTHWTALYIFPSNDAIYYDSFGLPIPTPILNFLSRYKNKLKILQSTDQIQEMSSIRCGWYALFFLAFMNNHRNCVNKRQLLNKHNAIYSLKRKALNDRILQELITRLFTS